MIGEFLKCKEREKGTFIGIRWNYLIFGRSTIRTTVLGIRFRHSADIEIVWLCIM